MTCALFDAASGWGVQTRWWIRHTHGMWWHAVSWHTMHNCVSWIGWSHVCHMTLPPYIELSSWPKPLWWMESHTDLIFGTLRVTKGYVLSVQHTGTIYVCAVMSAPRMRVLSILQYRTSLQSCYRNAAATIVVYDITRAVSCTLCRVSMLFLH